MYDISSNADHLAFYWLDVPVEPALLHVIRAQ